MTPRFASALGLIAVFVTCGVLSFYQITNAAPPVPSGPFANSVEQRADIVGQLREVNNQLKEMNALLRAGTLKVVIVPSEGK